MLALCVFYVRCICLVLTSYNYIKTGFGILMRLFLSDVHIDLKRKKHDKTPEAHTVRGFAVFEHV